jgi:hypothetical protein
MEIPKCEVCGEPANCVTRDYFVKDNWDTGMREYSPNNDSIHYYCNKHNRNAVGTDITESPLTYFHRIERITHD